MESDKKVTRRIGSFTFGIMMILIGVNIFIQTITSVDLLRFTLSLWPVVFILLGLETLYYSYKKEVEVKYDILGVITIFVVLFLGMIFSTVNYGVNKVLYNNSVKEDIIYYLTDTQYDYNFYGKININVNNEINDKVNVRFVENKGENEILVKVIYEYDDSFGESIARVFKERDLVRKVVRINSRDQQMNINSLPDFIKNVEVVVTASDKSEVKYNGKILK